MSKYDEEFKLTVVNAYLAEEGGYGSIAKRFGIKSPTNIKKWVNIFKKFGKEGLENKRTYKVYSVQFKLDVLNYKLRTGDSFEKVALNFAIPESALIFSWFKKWQSEGTEGLSKEKGRPSMSNKPNKKTIKKQLTKEQQLEKEVELLKAENAYLKKLRASGVNIPNRMLKQNPESSTNSEKNSN